MAVLLRDTLGVIGAPQREDCAAAEVLRLGVDERLGRDTLSSGEHSGIISAVIPLVRELVRLEAGEPQMKRRRHRPVRDGGRRT